MTDPARILHLEQTMNSNVQTTKIPRLTAALFFGALALSISVICSAGVDTSTVKSMETVRFTDIDLSKPRGPSALYARIRMAARDVCRSLDRRDLESQDLVHQCVHRAIVDAVTKVDLPALYAVYKVKNPEAKEIRLASGQIG
jgi:UrcA family protein